MKTTFKMNKIVILAKVVRLATMVIGSTAVELRGQPVAVEFGVSPYYSGGGARAITITPSAATLLQTDGTNVITGGPLVIPASAAPTVTNLWVGAYTVAIQGIAKSFPMTVTTKFGLGVPFPIPYVWFTTNLWAPGTNYAAAVTRIVAGTGIAIAPTDGVGLVTITATGSAGGGLTNGQTGVALLNQTNNTLSLTNSTGGMVLGPDGLRDLVSHIGLATWTPVGTQITDSSGALIQTGPQPGEVLIASGRPTVFAGTTNWFPYGGVLGTFYGGFFGPLFGTATNASHVPWSALPALVLTNAAAFQPASVALSALAGGDGSGLSGVTASAVTISYDGAYDSIPAIEAANGLITGYLPISGFEVTGSANAATNGVAAWVSSTASVNATNGVAAWVSSTASMNATNGVAAWVSSTASMNATNGLRTNLVTHGLTAYGDGRETNWLYVSSGMVGTTNTGAKTGMSLGGGVFRLWTNGANTITANATNGTISAPVLIATNALEIGTNMLWTISQVTATGELDLSSPQPGAVFQWFTNWDVVIPRGNFTVSSKTASVSNLVVSGAQTNAAGATFGGSVAVTNNVTVQGAVTAVGAVNSGGRNLANNCYLLPFCCAAGTVSANHTYYVGFFPQYTAGHSYTESQFQMAVPVAGTVIRVDMFASVNSYYSSETVNSYLRIGGANVGSAMALNLSSGGVGANGYSISQTGMSAAVNAGDLWDLSLVMPASFATTGTGLAISGYITIQPK